MALNNATTSGSGLFSKLVVLLLLALAIGLYLRIVMVEGESHYEAPPTQASVRVIEGDEPAPALGAQPLRDLPVDQMSLIEQTFATE